MTLLLACAKSHMLSASRRQPHLLHASAVDHHQTWSVDKSWRCVTLSGFLHIHIVRCRWNPISCGMHYSGPGLSENDSAVTTDVCEDQNREVGLIQCQRVTDMRQQQYLCYAEHHAGKNYFSRKCLKIIHTCDAMPMHSLHECNNW